MNEAARVCKHYFQGEFLFSSIAPEQVALDRYDTVLYTTPDMGPPPTGVIPLS